MTNKNDGGRAFPVGGEWQKDGMTLRDWFAGQALAGHIASTSTPEVMTLNSAAAARHGLAGKEELFMAKVAYTFADAMIEARGK